MRFNRKAAQRALDLAEERNDMRVIPFGLAFEYTGPLRVEGDPPVTRLGIRGAYHDDWESVAFAGASVRHIYSEVASYARWGVLKPALKSRSLKKHELRKQARDLRRMKQYD